MNVIRDDFKKNVEKYIDRVLVSVEQLYDEKKLNPLHFMDIIYLSSLAISLDKNVAKWTEIGYTLCYEMKGYIENYYPHKHGISMLTGFGYCCFAIEQFSKETHRLKGFSVSIHKLFLKEAYERANQYKLRYENTNSNDFDAISGVSGWLYYLVDYDKCEDKYLYEKAINAMIDYLVELTDTHDYKGDQVYNFHVPREKLFLESEKENYPNGIYNFGMSHGIIAPMLALSKVHAKGFRKEGVEQAINVIYQFYKDFEISTDDSVYWPAQLSYEDYLKNTVEESKHYASSWCYGNTGILMGLIMTAENMNWKEELNLLQDKLEKVLNRGIEHYFLASPALCHGYSSVLTTRLFRGRNSGVDDTAYIEENIAKIIDTSNQNTLLVKSDPNQIETEEGRLEGFIGDYSLLTGTTGIVAVFCELLYEIDDYRKILLIS